MAVIGTVESLWRYPVKSMCGEELSEAFIRFAGVYGDRLFAFKSSERPKGFPYLTGREQMQMLLYRLRFRHPAAGEWTHPAKDAAAITPTINDELHALLVKRADDLEGCTVGSNGERELAAIARAIEAYEAVRWPLGRTQGGKG
jgi:uncharacterized protein YcbX